MKIMIINPNSDLEMTQAIQESADAFVKNEFHVVCELTEGAPKFIETYEDQVKAAPGMIKLVKENEEEYDGFIVACHCDPNLDTIKEITKKPVVGIGEASMKIASMIGHSFSVISMTKKSIPIKESLIRKYHLQDALASVRAPDDEIIYSNEEEKFFDIAKSAIEEDMAEVIVLGCAGMTGMDKRLEKRLGVPVIDGVVCALIIIFGLIEYGVSTSKIRRYKPS
ncbi:MAG: Asp/Glu/hydantoin racemase [Candidatus Heimdallarchaeota archaeon]|nr:Asp/Glu/hydantoin racemase [Candidatus Heimdallarchaeota archaeon]MCK4953846.1 Asp/Glu/hydantoin racemase [Candidatus Heimdallarchaeota archaeon]